MQSLGFRPVAFEHAQADGVLLHLQHRLNTGSLEANLETADTAEQ